ncbi:MAG: transcription-repair coupling factor [Verrucomicrobiales bacterium]
MTQTSDYALTEALLAGPLLQRADPEQILAHAQTRISVPKKNGERPLRIHGVAAPGQPLIAFAAAKLLTKDRPCTIWMSAANLRAQDDIYQAMRVWHEEAIFLPRLEIAPVEGAVPDQEIMAERMHVLQRLLQAPQGLRVVVLASASWAESAPSQDSLENALLPLAIAQELSLEALTAKLEEADFEAVPQVSSRGQYARRGGIIDVYASNHLQPLRIEFFGDQIESLRHFELDSQMSTEKLEKSQVLLSDGPLKSPLTIRDYVNPDDLVIDLADDSGESHLILSDSLEPADCNLDTHEFDLGQLQPGDIVLAENKRALLLSQIEEWHKQDWQIYLLCESDSEVQRLSEIFEELSSRINWVIASLARGFIIPSLRLAVLTDAELLGRFQSPRARHAQGLLQRGGGPVDLATLEAGDFVVHLEHGIARYLGVGEDQDTGAETMTLEYSEGSKLHVPVEQAFLVSRYVGLGKKLPTLSTLGDRKWSRATSQVQRSVASFAAQLLTVQAQRETNTGFAFSPDKLWQQQFEGSFPYRETPDQLRAIEESKADMESVRPMDRLICGDVGFGKTEVAIRAAFKAVMDGKQVAILAPTTVLAQQHYHTFRQRMSEYPVVIDWVSRFRTAKETRLTLQATLAGEVDILIGTHRLVSDDVAFKNLGLVIIDEEQRFGVAHKEKLKAMFPLIDQLTLSATPIPRTLYLSLVGAKDMSTIETPPPNRYPIETLVCPYDERIVRSALKRELERGGQIYYLHNRVATIEKTASRLQELVPEAKILIGHGQMDEHQLEEVMSQFVAGQADILVATTIIESGLDIPNANTIMIDRADRFGLADLYQLRGRVGRAHHKAYAYLMLPRELMSEGAARKRIRAITQYSSLGAGFKIAMRDLEIRGAGNILGREQSGHVITVGFDLYCQLLRSAIAQLRGEAPPPHAALPIMLDFVALTQAEASRSPERLPILIPAQYISDLPLRIDAYRKLSECADEESLQKLQEQWRDRFGPLPEEVIRLFDLQRIRAMAARLRIDRVEVTDRKVVLRHGQDFIQIHGKFPRLQSKQPLNELRSLLEQLCRERGLESS